VKALRIILAFAALSTLGAASPAENPLGPSSLTCHEECRLKCINLYPGNPTMQDRCTWSCIDQKCGGGPFP
jgi:hypothetical protein